MTANDFEAARADAVAWAKKMQQNKAARMQQDKAAKAARKAARAEAREAKKEVHMLDTNATNAPL